MVDMKYPAFCLSMQRATRTSAIRYNAASAVVIRIKCQSLFPLFLRLLVALTPQAFWKAVKAAVWNSTVPAESPPDLLYPLLNNLWASVARGWAACRLGPSHNQTDTQMPKHLKSLIAGCMTLIASQAELADGPPRVSVKDSHVPCCDANWNGFYVGAAIGVAAFLTRRLSE
jgi:hypothetical protein